MKILFELRALPLSAFSLPSDGRKRKHLARLRQSLALLLATFANADGTKAFPSRKTLAQPLGVSVRTVAYLFEDLIALGFIVTGGWHPVHKTRVRSLRVPEKFRTKEACNLEPEPCNLDEEPGRIAPGTVQDSFGTQPPGLPPSKPSPPTSARSKSELASEGWEEGFFVQPRIYDRMDSMPKKVRDRLMEETKSRGFAKVKKAVDLFLRESFDRTSAPWMLFLSKADNLFAKAEYDAKEDPDAFRRKYILTEEEAKRELDAFIEAQTAKLVQDRTKNQGGDDGAGLFDPCEEFGEPTVETENPMAQYLRKT